MPQVQCFHACSGIMRTSGVSPKKQHSLGLTPVLPLPDPSWEVWDQPGLDHGATGRLTKRTREVLRLKKRNQDDLALGAVSLPRCEHRQRVSLLRNPQSREKQPFLSLSAQSPPPPRTAWCLEQRPVLHGFRLPGPRLGSRGPGP